MQVSDRQLTTDTGAVLTEDETKVVYIETPDAQFIMGYTGLAMVGKQPTNQILMELLFESFSSSGVEIDDAIPAFVQALSKRWQEWSVRRHGSMYTRLSVVLTGFRLLDDRSYGPFQILLTNFQDWGKSDSVHVWDEFKIQLLSPKDEWSTLLQRIGNYDALPLEMIEELRPLLAEGKPPEAARDKILSWRFRSSRPSILRLGLGRTP